MDINQEGTIKVKEGKEEKEVPEVLVEERKIKFEKTDKDGNSVKDKSGKVVMEEKSFKIAYIPVRDSKGQKIGMIAVASETKDMDAAIKEFDKSKKVMVIGILGTLILIAIVGIVYTLVK